MVSRLNGYGVMGFVIRGLDMIHFMIFIYGRTPFFSPFVFFSFMILCLERTRNMNTHFM